ncbi:hypothetical protein GQ600_14259 [Phytophthora cactorum]|nr:hypothetical protein GQ600_14259 [Phytophthora cactorum]
MPGIVYSFLSSSSRSKCPHVLCGKKLAASCGVYGKSQRHFNRNFAATIPWSPNHIGAPGIIVCVLSPFPCLLVLTLIDCAPLAPLRMVREQTTCFGARFLDNRAHDACNSRAISNQCTRTTHRLSAGSAHASYLQRRSCSIHVAMSSVIGFPLPFTLVVGILVWFVVLVVCFVAFFGRILKRDPVLLRELLRSIVVLICQVLLTFVYPAYLYGFISIEPANQKFYVMLLPIIKIIAKNWISYCLGNKFDLLPQIMIFNVDVFNALYVSSSMQASQSSMTVVQMCSRGIDIGHPAFHEDDLCSKAQDSCEHQLKNASFIEIAIQIIDEDPQARERLACVNIAWHMPFGEAPLLLKLTSAHRQADGYSLPIHQTLGSCRNGHSEKSIPQAKVSGQDFLGKERQRFLQYSARVLFTTEFIILVEYTEVIVPFIYSVYTAAMFYLPNHHYYPQLQSFDDTGLASSLGNVVTFGFIELSSLLVIGYLIQRMLRISILHLLVFVLDRSWRMVQSNLFLWICYTIQNSLEHNGADFSFAFSWLRASTSRDSVLVED